VTLTQYIESLRVAVPSAEHIELDKEKELQYMLTHRYRFARILASIPRDRKTLRLLDIGTTPFTIFIKERYPQYDVWSLDRTPLLEARCTAHGVRLRICDLDNEPLPFDEEFFDLIIFTEVLEHVFAPPNQVLSGIRRILRPEGKLVISVPNIACLDNRIKLLMGISVLESANHQLNKDWVHGHGHIHEYTMKEMVGVLENCGFQILRKGFLRRPFWESLTMPGQTWSSRVLHSAYCTARAVWPAFGTHVFIEGQRRSIK